MNTQQLSRADYLDILFDGRNKAYGSYELRRHYPQRVRNALIGVIFFTGSTLAYPLLANNSGAPLIRKPIVVITPIEHLKEEKKEVEKHIPPPPVPPAPAPTRTTIANPLPEIKPDELVKNLLKPNDSLMNKAIALKDDPGEPGGLIPDSEHKKGKGEVVETTSKSAGEIIKWVSQMPEFDGNLGSWLNNHVMYPYAERTDGKEGKVIVQFVVNTDGSISDVSVVKSAGAGLDEEAIRVVHAMPHWKPGRNNGDLVRVWFTLPIQFTLEP